VRRSSDSSLSARLFHVYTTAFLAIALVFGGASRSEVVTSDIVALLALPLIGLSIWRLRAVGGIAPEHRLPLIVLAAILALPLIQLIPLPPGLWTALPGRDLVLGGLRDAGLTPGWAPISLSPSRTWAAFLSLTPPVAMFLAVLCAHSDVRRRLVVVLLTVGALSVLLGALQLAGGQDSALRFYEITNKAAAVGFFSNSNHLASLLICTVILASAWAIQSGMRRPPARYQMAAAIGVALVATLGEGGTGSRAGLLLLAPAGLGILVLAWKAGVAHGRGKLVLGILAAGFVAGLVIVQLSFGETLARLQTGFGNEVRIVAAEIGLKAAKAFAPFGSGFGTFVPAYKIFEGPESVINTYINHAHDDWLEVLIEGGALAVLVAAGFLFWFGRTALALWRRGGVEATLARAGSLVVLLLLIHSGLDYPLRSPAMMTVFALACALMLPTASRSRLRPTAANMA